MTLTFSCEVVHENYENPSIFVSYSKKISGTFFSGHGVDVRILEVIEVYKLLTNKYDSRVNFYLEKQQDSITRGHSLKLVNNRYHCNLRNFFAPKIVNVWNSLPEIVISADTTDTFKRRLDKFWQHYMIIRLS